MGILRTDRLTHSSLEPTGSVLFDGTTDSITIPSHDALAFGTADWTVEGWFYFTSLSGQQTLVGDTYGSTAGFYLYKQSNNRLGVYYTSLLVDGVTEIEVNRWYHLAFVRHSGITSIYIDGVSDKSATDTTNATITQYYIADTADQSSGEFFGYISNLRITRTAVYKENFTVPKSELKNIPGTILLCCQSSSSTTESAVSVAGTLTANGDPTATSFTPDLKKDITDIGPVFADNTKFDTLSYMVPPKGTTEQRSRGRGLFFGGYAPSPNALRNIIDYVQIQSQGNALDFGDLLSINNGEGGNCASSTRALAGGGFGNIKDITYVTIATTGNATTFGELLTGRRSLTAVSNDTRGLFAGGTTPSMKEEIEYVTIATTADALDFGDLMEARRNLAPNSSPTRGVFAGGNPGSSPLYTKKIDYVTIASLGSQANFGELITAMREQAGSSSSTRGLIAGGYTAPSHLNTIEYITIASTGNALDYGDLHTGRSGMSGTSNGTRGIFAGGSYINNIQYVTIATTGNAQDFGDLTAARFLYGATSDSHGGIS